MVDLGEPEHYAYCPYCEGNIGGPYFDIGQARARRKEHVANLHDTGVKKDWAPTVKRRKRGHGLILMY